MHEVALFRDRQGHVRWGMVVQQNRGKCEVVDSHYRRQHIPTHRVLFTLKVPVEGSADQVIQHARNGVESQIRQIDLHLLWEITVEEEREYRLGELVELYFGADSAPVHEVALWLKLESDSLYFRAVGKGYRPRAREHVAAILHQQEQERERAAAVARLVDVFQRWLATGRIDETDRAVAEVYLSWVRHRLEPEMAHRVGKAVQQVDALRQNPLALLGTLKAAGFVQDDLELLLLHHGVELTFEPEVEAFAASLSRVTLTPPAREGEWVFSIDDAETREVDDAIGIRKLADGSFEITVYIADAALYVAKDTPLDRAAERRVATLYLPERTIYMLPPRISTDLASLVEGDPRSSLALRSRWSSSFQLLAWSLERCSVVIHDRFTFDEADALLDRGSNEEHRERLKTICAIAEKLGHERHQRGAMHLVRPEVKVRVRWDEAGHPTIQIRRINTESPAHRMIREWMIFYNARVADWAVEHGVPMIFRVQDAPETPELMETPATDYDPVQFRRIVRKFKRSLLWPTPRDHWALGLSAYVQMSSPLRRYADLVTQRQLTYFLEKGQALYDRDTMLKILTAIEEKLYVLKEIEQRRHRFWIFQDLKSRPKDTVYAATVVEIRPGTVLVELDDFLIEALVTGPYGGDVGERVFVRIVSLNEERLQLKVQIVERV